MARQPPFFEIGSLVEAYPEVSRQIVAQGCEIGNHSYSHRQLTSLSAAEIEEQTRKTQQAIKNAVGYEPTLTRPTYGDINNTVKNCIDMPLILWSIDTLDWKSKDAQAVAEHILSNVKEGDIILMHDVYPLHCGGGGAGGGRAAAARLSAGDRVHPAGGGAGCRGTAGVPP